MKKLKRISAVLLCLVVAIAFAPEIPGLSQEAEATPGTINITGITTPVAGSHGGDLSLYASISGCTVESVEAYWLHNGTKMESSDTFQAGSEYELYVDIFTANDLDVSQLCSYTLNHDGPADLQIEGQAFNVWQTGAHGSYSDLLHMTLSSYEVCADVSAISNIFYNEGNTGYIIAVARIDDSSKGEGVNFYLDGVKVSSEKRTYWDDIQSQIAVTAGEHKLYARAYRTIGGIVYEGPKSEVITIEGVKLVSPTVTAVKISSSKVRVSWYKQTPATGVAVYNSSNKKLGSSTKSHGHVTYKASGAAKKKYYSKAYYKCGSTQWGPKGKVVKVSPNKWTSSFSPGPSYYGYTQKNYAKLNALYYSKANSKGKLKATFTVTNCWKYFTTKSCKVKITVKSQGKTVASQTFTAKSIKPWAKKKFTVTFKKAKTGYDISNIGIDSYSIKVTKVNQ